MPKFFLSCFAAVCLSIPELATGQVSPGVPNFSAFDGHEVDTVNLMNNNVSLAIPIVSKPGAFPVTVSFNGNYYVYSNNAVWQASATQLNTQLLSSANNFIAANGLVANTPQPNVACPGSGTTTKYINWHVIEANGTAHALPSTDFSDRTSEGTSCLNGSGFTAQTIDSSGLTVTVASNGSAATSVYARNGMLLSGTQITDSNSNLIILSAGTITDTLGVAAVSGVEVQNGAVSWTDVNLGSPQVGVTTAGKTLKTTFNCSGIGDINNTFLTTLPTGLTFPDQGTPLGLSYETTPLNSPKVTGRLHQITLREGGTVAYTYGGPNNGIDCTYQTAPVLTRTLGNGDVTTYTLTHPQIGSGSQYQAVNTVVDPGGNKTLYTFTGFTRTGTSSQYGQVLTMVQRYQGSGTLLITDKYCYNTNTTNCDTAQVMLPLSEVDVYHTINGMSTSSRVKTTYDSYGNVTETARYDFGGSAPVTDTTITYGSWNGTTCTAVGSNVNDKVCESKTVNGSNTIADSRFTYDSQGNLLTNYFARGDGVWLSNLSVNVYLSNGTPSILYDLGNTPTRYSYDSASYSDGACTKYPFATSTTKNGITTYATYDCTGGAKLTDTDANGNVTTYLYTSSTGADPFWRVRQTNDAYGATFYSDYLYDSSLSDGYAGTMFASASVNQTYHHWDGYHRPSNEQRDQQSGGTSYDTVSHNYNNVASNYRRVDRTQACSTTLLGNCSIVAHSDCYDPLGRLYQSVTTGNETLTNYFNQNDVKASLTPPPSGENSKNTEKEYDGLQRLRYSCLVGDGSSTACGGRNLYTLNGVTDAYSYTYAAGSSTVSITRGIQTRSQTFDAMGRVTQKVTPEGGSWHYTYDTGVAGCSWSNGNMGMLSKVTDPNGHPLCYVYDYLNRVITVNANGTACRHYYYDNSTGYSGTIPTGITLANQYGRMVEAATDDCSGNNLLTAEWFAYDKDGRVTDIWQSTPHSGGWYHSTASYFANGQLSSLTLPGLGTTTYTLEGEGRWYSAKLGSVTLVPSVT